MMSHRQDWERATEHEIFSTNIPPLMSMGGNSAAASYPSRRQVWEWTSEMYEDGLFPSAFLDEGIPDAYIRVCGVSLTPPSPLHP